MMVMRLVWTSSWPSADRVKVSFEEPACGLSQEILQATNTAMKERNCHCEHLVQTSRSDSLGVSRSRLETMPLDIQAAATHSTVALPSFPRVTLPVVCPSRMSRRF